MSQIKGEIVSTSNLTIEELSDLLEICQDNGIAVKIDGCNIQKI